MKIMTYLLTNFTVDRVEVFLVNNNAGQSHSLNLHYRCGHGYTQSTERLYKMKNDSFNTDGTSG